MSTSAPLDAATLLCIAAIVLYAVGGLRWMARRSTRPETLVQFPFFELGFLAHFTSLACLAAWIERWLWFALAVSVAVVVLAIILRRFVTGDTR